MTSITPARADDALSVQLIGELDAGLRQDYLPGQMFGLHPGEASDDRLRFFHLEMDGEIIGCGAYRMLSEEMAELKRMYIRQSHRGRGISHDLIGLLEADAVRRGVRVMRLETGRFEVAAMGLYRASGYERIPAYGQYIGSSTSICMEKTLPNPQR